MKKLLYAFFCYLSVQGYIAGESMRLAHEFISGEYQKIRLENVARGESYALHVMNLSLKDLSNEKIGTRNL